MRLQKETPVARTGCFITTGGDLDFNDVSVRHVDEAGSIATMAEHVYSNQLVFWLNGWKVAIINSNPDSAMMLSLFDRS